jgi:hypothetical protein
MCTAALVVLLTIAVLAIPALARIVGAVVLILLVVGMVAAIAEPAWDPTIPTCQNGWFVLAVDDRRPLPPCHPGWERSPSSGLCVPDCKPYCMPKRVAEAQTRFYGRDGRSLGTATPQARAPSNIAMRRGARSARRRQIRAARRATSTQADARSGGPRDLPALRSQSGALENKCR